MKPCKMDGLMRAIEFVSTREVSPGSIAQGCRERLSIFLDRLVHCAFHSFRIK